MKPSFSPNMETSQRFECGTRHNKHSSQGVAIHPTECREMRGQLVLAFNPQFVFHRPFPDGSSSLRLALSIVPTRRKATHQPERFRSIGATHLGAVKPQLPRDTTGCRRSSAVMQNPATGPAAGGPPVVEPRIAHLNAPEQNQQLIAAKRYARNVIVTSKYTVVSFVPKTIFEFFRVTANIYFLVISLLQVEQHWVRSRILLWLLTGWM